MERSVAKIVTIVIMLAVPGVIALDEREMTVLRTVRGTVVDARGRALPSSVVYLHRQKTHEVRTHITDGNGQYRFSGSHPHADYEIHAKHGDRTSAVHKLYATDRKRDVTLDLKVDNKQKSKPFCQVLSPTETWLRRLATTRGIRQAQRGIAILPAIKASRAYV